MEVTPLSKLSRDYLDQLVMVIPLFKLVKQQDVKQFELLLQASRILTYTANEVVLRRGDNDSWLYFLLKGRLAVYIEESSKKELVNYVTPGEVFGDLSQLVGQPRTATVITEPNFRESMVLAMDSSIFSSVESEAGVDVAGVYVKDAALNGRINVKTKLVYYRSVVHNLRWKLEVYRSQHLQHALANKHRKIKLYQGVKDTVDELHALYAQAQELARLLLEWNYEFGALPPDLPSPSDE